MHQQKTDIAVLGAGFAGSLIALILKQIGLQVLLIEKSKHPRFAIGESSTPLANLHLEAICEQYNLPKIRPLCKYGSWQKHYPQIACGLKRGFSYFKHDENVAFAHSPDHGNELLVAASPNDEVSDTQWFREHVDLLFLQEAQAAEVEYWPETSVIKMAQSETGWRLECEKKDGHVRVDAAFLLDATGSGALVADALNIPSIVQNIKTRSWSVFSHFRDVRLWHDELEKAGGLVADHPFHCDHAALHHIFDDGWMWLLRFNNDVTSAGFAFAGEAPAIYNQPEAFWQFKIRHFPSIAAQFSAASAVQPFFFAPRLQRCWQQSAGSNWAMLPHAAYFLDPLYSAGIAHTLLGLRRLAAIIEGIGNVAVWRLNCESTAHFCSPKSLFSTSSFTAAILPFGNSSCSPPFPCSILQERFSVNMPIDKVNNRPCAAFYFPTTRLSGTMPMQPTTNLSA